MTASGYRRRAASIAPNASKSVFPCVAMTCSARIGPLSPKVDAVPHLTHLLPQPFLVRDAAVRVPAGELVEPTRARVVLEDPQDGFCEAVRAQAHERLPHQRLAGTRAPDLG